MHTVSPHVADIIGGIKEKNVNSRIPCRGPELQEIEVTCNNVHSNMIKYRDHISGLQEYVVTTMLKLIRMRTTIELQREKTEFKSNPKGGPLRTLWSILYSGQRNRLLTCN